MAEREQTGHELEERTGAQHRVMVGAQRFCAENLSNDILGGIQQSRANVLRSQLRRSGRGRIAWNRRSRLGLLGVGEASKSCANNSDIVCQGDIPQGKVRGSAKCAEKGRAEV